MNTGVTLIEVRREAMDVIQKLKKSEIDIKTASEIRDLLSVIIDTAKTQVEFLKAIPNSLKEKMSEETIKTIAGALADNKEDDKPVKKLGLFNNPYEIIEDINKQVK